MVDVATASVSRRSPAVSAVLPALIGILYWTAHTMIRPLVGPEVISLGGSANLASITLAAFAVLPTLVAIPIGAFTDRIGSKRMLVQGTVLMVVGGVAMATSLGIVGLLVSQVVIGIGTLMAWVSLQATVTSVGEDDTPDRRNARIATFSLYLAAGQALGPLLGGVIADAAGATAAFVAFTALSTLLLVLSCFSVGSARRTSPSAGAWTEAARSFPAAGRLGRRPVIAVGVVVSFMALVSLDLRNAFLPLLLGPEGLGPTEVGTILTVAAAASFASRPLFPLAVRRLRPSWMVGLVLGTSAFSSAAFVVVDGLPALLAVAVVNGFVLGFAQPLTLTMMADHTAPRERGLASGLRSMANRAAQFANPAVMAGVAVVGGITSGFVVISAGILLSAVVCAWGVRGDPGGGVLVTDDVSD